MRFPSNLPYFAAPLAAALLAVTPVAAQQGGLVNVSLSNIVIQDIAQDINVDVSQIPVTVQVPIGVAANVCNVDANVLAQQNQTDPDGVTDCTAENSSRALSRVIQRQIKRQQ